MSPTLALVLTLVFIAWLFRRDFRQNPNVTWAIWVPTLWMFIIASRPVSAWLSIFGLPSFPSQSVEEGSPLDASVFFALMAVGVYVVHQRRINLAAIARENRWLVIFLLYCFLAIFWSDYPLVSFKRWIKILGHPIMVLVLISEPAPDEALSTVLKRCAYVLFPVSILWMKYYPALGRKSDEWGATMNIGITGGKNELGSMSLLFGVFVFWHLLQAVRSRGQRWWRKEVLLTAVLLILIGYCLKRSNSSTSMLTFLFSLFVMLCLGLRSLDKRSIGVYVLGALLFVTSAQLLFDVYGSVVDLTGHGSTIEGRGRLWEVLLETSNDPVLGTGFESYWMGERIQKIWAYPEFRWHPNQAHNGYVETYINLGAVGVVLLFVLIMVAFFKCKRDLLADLQWGRFTMSYLIAVVVHNWTEAGFKGLSPIYFAFFLVLIEYRRRDSGTIVAAPFDRAILVDELAHSSAMAACAVRAPAPSIRDSAGKVRLRKCRTS